jgi:hypothetical protein
MRDDERLFSFGLAFIIFSVLIVTIFQVAFDSDEKKLRQKNARIISLEQDLKNASADFSALVRPEILRPIVMQIYPAYRPIGTSNIVSVKNME